MRPICIAVSAIAISVVVAACRQQREPPKKLEVSSQPVEVETFTGVTTHSIDLPAKPDGRHGLTFTGTTTWTSLSFAPGAVQFRGRPVDFAGKEEDFMSTRYHGEVHVPADSGPNAVKVRGVLTAEGFVFPHPQVGNSTAQGLQLGRGFSAKNLNLVPGQEFQVTMTSLNWESPLIPELNGATVKLVVDKAITSTDPAAGLLHIKMKGRIVAEEPAVGCQERC